MARRGDGRMATRKSAFLREQLGNNRPRSGRVVGCRFVFAADNPIRSDRTRHTVRADHLAPLICRIPEQPREVGASGRRGLTSLVPTVELNSVTASRDPVRDHFTWIIDFAR
jgi:hypothetical protein